MYYITGEQESLSEIINKRYGSLVCDKLYEDLQMLNRNINFWYYKDFLPPYITLFLPDVPVLQKFIGYMTLDGINSMPYKKRWLLKKICELDVDPNLILATVQACRVNIVNRENNKQSLLSIIGPLNKSADLLKKNLLEINNKIAIYINMSCDKFISNLMNEIRSIYKSIQKIYQHRVTYNYNKKAKLITAANLSCDFYDKKGFIIANFVEAQKLVASLEYCEYFTPGLFLINIYPVGAINENNYLKYKELAIQLNVLFTKVIGGGTVLFVLAPDNWVAVIINPLAALAYGNNLSKAIINSLWQHSTINPAVRIPGNLPVNSLSCSL